MVAAASGPIADARSSTHTRRCCFLKRPFDAAVQLIVGCHARRGTAAGVAYRIIPFSDTTSILHSAAAGNSAVRLANDRG